ncbi:general substrate transporter [Rhizodiscina lignyota]|uniref:General substrate transporter n=1 Tax=Rhizodiscina lignyota TaxID=1504668 RepID=A0A9P4M2M5_9PEZI|nr:general substrate transporter [Rhizodiscina lignyota]
MGFTPNWEEVQPQNKWRILLKQSRFALWALYSSVGSMMLGFDYGTAGTATAYPAFQEQFGIPWPSAPSGYLVPARWQSGWSAATSAGGLVGALLAGWLVEKIGRKHLFGGGAVVTAVGIAMQVGSHEWKLFLGGRIVNGEANEVNIALIQANDLQVAAFSSYFSLRQFGLVRIQNYEPENCKIGLELTKHVAILLVIYPFFPESPYYLIKIGKDDAARKALIHVHGGHDQSLIDAEMKRLAAQVEFSEELQRAAMAKGPPLLQVFQGTNLKRTMIAVLPVAGQQFIGAAFVLGYITYFLSLLKVNDYFTVSVVLYIIMLLSNLSAFVFAESVGRRTLLVPGIFCLTVTLLVMGIMGCLTSSAAIWVILVCIFLWAIAYQLTVGACGFALASEISTLPLRPAAQTVVLLAQLIVGWVIGFISPYMINPDAGNLGAKVGFVFFGMGVPLCVLFYFYIPETKGLSFEEMDYLFNNHTSCRHFQSAIKARRAAAGNVLEVEVGGEIVKGETSIVKGETTATAEQVSTNSDEWKGATV